MKYFLDSAKIDEIKYALENWKIDGVTSNPKHIKNSGKPFFTVIKEFAEEFGVRAYLNFDTIKIEEMGDIPLNIFEKMIQWVESKGYKVDRSQSDNTFDMDDDRYFYPRIVISK